MTGVITVQPNTAAKVYIDVSDPIMLEEIYEFFKYKDEKAQTNHFSRWDGVVRLFDKNKQLLPRGLVRTLFEFTKNAGYELKVEPNIFTNMKITDEELSEYIEGLKLTLKNEDGSYTRISPYDYQFEGIKEGINNDSCVLLADTNAGKTLILYVLSRFMLDLFAKQAKILILVPSVMLVNQGLQDFENYSHDDESFDSRCIHTISAGKNKYRSAPITISTWQSIQDEDPEFFHRFTHVFCDEVHGAAASKITKILNQCINAYKRVGVTGSLKECDLHILQVMSHFSKIIRIATTQMLKERGQSADTLIRMMTLNYSKEQKRIVNGLDYQGRIEYLVNHEGRNKYLAAFASGLKGNTLMMFDRKKHSQALYDILKDMPGKKVYRIDGDVPETVREEIKAAAESNDGVIILASYGTMSTGVSVKRLHNLLLCHPVESIIRVLQTIGRMLRTHSTKNTAYIFDFVDNLAMHVSDDFVFLKHAKSRHRYYSTKGHKTVMANVDFTSKKSVPPEVLEQIIKDSNKRKVAAEYRKLNTPGG